jgi:hypothetical protein
LPAGEKEGERLGEVSSLKWGTDRSSGGGSGTSAWRTPARRGRAAPGRRGARRRLPAGEAPGGTGAWMRRMSGPSHGWRAPTSELCGGAGRLRAPAVGGSNRGEKGMGSGGVWEENRGGGSARGHRVEEKRRMGGCRGLAPIRARGRRGRAAVYPAWQHGSRGKEGGGGLVGVGCGWAMREGVGRSGRGGKIQRISKSDFGFRK